MGRFLSTHTRSLPPVLWTINALLAACLVWSFLANASSSREDAVRPSLPDPASFRISPDPGRQEQSGLGKVSIVAHWLQPRPPVRPEVASAPGEPESAEPPPLEEFESGGPLAEDWEYTGGILFLDEPARSRVWLRKKSSRRTTRIIRSRRSRSRRVSSRTRRRKLTDRISFSISQGVFEDEDLDLEFMIHSADHEAFVYSLPENPERKYRLQRVEEDPYVFSREKSLEPGAEGPPGDQEEDREQGEKHFRIRSADFADHVEEDYRRLLRGEELDATTGANLD
jgi:hypothetical protein